MCDDTSHNDRPALESSDIDITPEMIEAAMRYWIDEWGMDWPISHGYVEEFFCGIYKSISSAAHR